MCKHPHNDINPNTGKLYTHCAECREKKRQHRKQYYTENRDKLLEDRKQYYTENRDKELKYRKQYYTENRDRILKQKKQYRQNNPFKIWLKYSKQADIKNNRYDPNNFITEEYCEHIAEQSNNKCHYCLCDLSWDVEDKHTRSPNRATIERLDNSLGHIIGNCVVACNLCNIRKVGDRPFEERMKLRIVNMALIEVL